jgi:hypothetical protein
MAMNANLLSGKRVITTLAVGLLAMTL